MSSHRPSPTVLSRFVCAAALCLLGACSHRPAPAPAELPLPAAWDSPPDRPAPATLATGAPAPWWTRTRDPAITEFMAAADAGHPSADEVLARVDEARADLNAASAAGRPAVTLNATAARVRARADDADNGGATLARSASAGVGLHWELDLAGRIRAAASAAQHRLAAREADVQNTRLMLSHDVVAAGLSLRGCALSARLQEASAASRAQSVEVLRARARAGLVARVDVEREAGRLALAQVDLASQREACARLVQQLATLTGLSPARIRARLDDTAPTDADAALADGLDDWPAAALPLPATVLLHHPSVVLSAREMDAAWADIAQAKAARWPRLSLEAQLSREWLGAGGAGSWFTPWSIGPALAATLFDGGANAARVSAAQARYRQALARLQLTVRQATEDIENGLAAVAFADQRASASRESLASAREVWRVARLRQGTGELSQLELEDARRQFLAAQLAAVAAGRDRALAWAALVRASGHAGVLEREGA